MADYRAKRLARMLADHKQFTAHSNPMTETNIAAPSELVKQWTEPSGYKVTPGWLNEVIQKAIQYGADQELEACCEWMKNASFGLTVNTNAYQLRAARRPKPPTLNSIALQMLGTIERDAHYLPEITDTIRKALEQLDD